MDVLVVVAILVGSLIGGGLSAVGYVIISNRMYADHRNRLAAMQADHNKKMAKIWRNR